MITISSALPVSPLMLPPTFEYGRRFYALDTMWGLRLFGSWVVVSRRRRR